ncbi:hypothetical protein, partial [Segatella oulorum]|uniref:hypothetical protein n=1 Tax=Segatella oulorum TaxID=28136 RepID=UPI0028ECEA0F
EATLEPDTAGCAQTRAGNPVPDGTYKIYAIDAGGTRHDGLTGTMTGGVFTPSGYWELEAGTYTFVCINNAVTDNGNELYANLNYGQMPLIGVSDPVTVTNPFDVFVSFVMRHPQARIRYQFVSYTEPIESPSLGWLNSDPTFGVGSAYFDLKGNRLRDGGTSAVIFYNSGVLHLNQPYQPSSVTKEYTYTTDYILCSPEYNSMTYYAITSNLYGRAVHSNKGVQVGPLQKNHSYIWKLKFKNKDPWYLYNDGTIGSLAKRGSRTPIGIVVKEKLSESDQGTACALNLIYGSWKNVGDNLVENVNPSPTSIIEAAADMNGYNWTYQPNLQGVVRANEPTTYPAFYKAAHYNPGVPTASNIGQWYLPSYGEWIKLVQVFDKTYAPSATESIYPHHSTCNITMAKVQSAFTNAGSTSTIYGGPLCLCSTEINESPTYCSFWADNSLYSGICWNTMGSQFLPFVHF